MGFSLNDLNPFDSSGTAGGVVSSAIGAPANIIGGITGQSGQQAGQAQGQIAQEQERRAYLERQQAFGVSQPTVDELATMHQQMSSYTTALDNQQRLIDAIDPALMEAGRQALKLMQGESAPILKPLQEQQARDRTQLTQDLISQYGPGALGTTAGQNAMMKFDQASQMATASAQQNSLNSLLSTSAASRPNPFQGVQAGGQILQGQQNQQGLQLNALDANKTTNVAGSQYAGDLAKARENTAYTGSLMNLGGTVAGAAIGKSAVGKPAGG